MKQVDINGPTVPDTLENRNIHARVTGGDGKTKMTVYERPVKEGEIVLVDEITFRNLEKKGRLTKATREEIAKATKPEESKEEGGDENKGAGDKKKGAK